MKKFQAYQHIDNFKNAYGHIMRNIPQDHGPCYVSGTVKIHGTNAGVARIDGKLVPYSRTRIISAESDNYDFAKFVLANEAWFHAAFDELADFLPEMPGSFLVIYGEYAGPSVQTTVALSRLTHRMFFPFAATVATGDEEPYYLTKTPFLFSNVPASPNIFPIPTLHERYVNFHDASQVRDFLAEVETLTEAVDKQCPIALALGIYGNGEGIVWEIRYKLQKMSGWDARQIFFKSKGHSHRRAGEKKLQLTDPGVSLQINEFVQEVLSEDRLVQCADFLRADDVVIDIRATGAFLKHINVDVTRECAAEITEAGFDSKLVARYISAAAAKWYKGYISEV